MPTISSTPNLKISNPLAKPKILHIVKDQKVGGVKSTLSGLVNSDLATAFNFTVLTASADRPIWESLHLRPDVIICHQPCRFVELPRFVLLRLLNLHAKIVIHEHGYSQGYEQFNVASTARFHFMLKLFYSWVDQVVAISKAQEEWMLKNNLVNPGKLTTITQCPSLKKFFAVTPKPIEKSIVLAAYGRFCSHKGFDVLLQALQLIPDIPIKLYLAGEGPQEPELRQLAQGLDRVEFVGRVDHVPEFLQSCDAVVIPSRWEPWGNVCLEAKAAGKPVIASDIDGLTEQVQNCGLLVAPNCPKKLAEAIAHLATLPETQLIDWGRNGRELVKESDKKYFAEWQKFLEEISTSQS